MPLHYLPPRQYQPQPSSRRAPQGWFKVCSKQEDNDICNTQNIVTADSGQLLTAVNLIEIKGKINRKIFQVSVPTGRLIAPGVGLQINGGKTQKIDYAICFPDRCISEVALSDELLAVLQEGQSADDDFGQFPEQAQPDQCCTDRFHPGL